MNGKNARRKSCIQHQSVQRHYLNVLKQEESRRQSLETRRKSARSLRRPSFSEYTELNPSSSTITTTIPMSSPLTIPMQDMDHRGSVNRVSFSKSRHSLSKSCASEFAPISDEVASLYSRVRKSHALFQLGLDEEGGEVLEDEKYCGIIPKCKKEKKSKKAGSASQEFSFYKNPPPPAPTGARSWSWRWRRARPRSGWRRSSLAWGPSVA